MEKFCVNKNEQDNGDHEVHRRCVRLPEPESQEYLGELPDSYSAVREAKRRHPDWNVNGCYYCCPESHKT